MTDDDTTTLTDDDALDPVFAEDDREDEAEDDSDEPQDDEDGADEETFDSDVVPQQEPPTPTDGLSLRTLQLRNFSVGPTGLVVTGEPTLDEWAGIGELLRTLEHGLQWAIGDWICAGEGRFGDQAAQVLDHTAWSVRTTAVYRWIASRVPPENRRPELTFSHHGIVADMAPDEQREWLAKAVGAADVDGEVWSVQRLKREMAVVKAKGTTMRYLLVVDCPDA